MENIKLSTRILKRALGYTFKMYRFYDENNSNNECFKLTVSNRTLKIKEHAILTYHIYIVGMFDDKVREYMFNVIETAINLKIDNLGLTDVLYIEKNASNFIVHKAGSILYEPASISYDENYDKLYTELEYVITHYKNYF